jgi:hypothetical protein
MRSRLSKLVFVLIILMVIDIAKPFGYTLLAELSFLGIIYAAFNFSLISALIVASLTGYAFDCVSFFNIPLHCVEFASLVLLSNYVLFHFRKRAIKIILFALVLLIHVTLKISYGGMFSFLFCSVYCAQSALIFLLLNHILKQWIMPSSAGSISPAL